MPSNIKQVIQDLIIPEFRTLSSEIKRLDEKIDNVRSEVDEKFKRLDERIDNLDRKFSAQIDMLREEVRFIRDDFKLAISLHERIAALEAKINK